MLNRLLVNVVFLQHLTTLTSLLMLMRGQARLKKDNFRRRMSKSKVQRTDNALRSTDSLRNHIKFN